LQAKYNQRFCSLAKTGFLFIFPRTESYLSFAQHFSLLDVFVIAIQAIHLSFSKQHKNTQFPWFKPNSSSLNLAFLPPSPCRSHPTMGPRNRAFAGMGPAKKPSNNSAKPSVSVTAWEVWSQMGLGSIWISYGTNQQLEDQPSDKHTIK
jgi:hypothetical protein